MHSLPRKTSRRGMEAFASSDFRRFQLARVAGVLGYAAQSVAVAWQVYSITHRALDLGYTGLAQFLPGLLFLLPAGHVADRFDRRRIILICYTMQAFCTTALLLLTRAGLHSVYPIYLVLFFIGMARSFSGPANSALIPHLVPEEHFVNAVTWGATIFQFATIIGPAWGGRAIYTASEEFCARQLTAGRRDCVCLYTGHAWLGAGTDFQYAHALGAHGTPSTLFKCCAGRLSVHEPFASTAGRGIT